MLHVLYGPDRFRAREELHKLRLALDPKGTLGNSTVEFDRDQARRMSVNELRSACQTASLFADEPRLVIIEGLQARFSGQRRRGSASRASARRAETALSELEVFAELLTSLPESTTVILLDDSGAAAFLDAVSGSAKVKEFPVMRPDDVRRWLGERVRERGASISPQALERLLAMLDGNHLGELAQELDKLSLYALGRRIELQDVEEVGSSALEFQSWDLTDAIIAGRAERALDVLQRIDRSRYPAQMLFVMITRQYRQMLVGQAMLKDGMGQAQIGTSLGLSPFPLKKVVEQAGRTPADRLEAAYRRLLEADVSIKTGVLDVETVLDMVVVELSELARQPRVRSAPIASR